MEAPLKLYTDLAAWWPPPSEYEDRPLDLCVGHPPRG